jgi:hypothetical protein
MAVIKSILHQCAPLQPAGFAQLTPFLGIILLATPLRQERRVVWVLLQLLNADPPKRCVPRWCTSAWSPWRPRAMATSSLAQTLLGKSKTSSKPVLQTIEAKETEAIPLVIRIPMVGKAERARKNDQPTSFH